MMNVSTNFSHIMFIFDASYYAHPFISVKLKPKTNLKNIESVRINKIDWPISYPPYLSQSLYYYLKRLSFCPPFFFLSFFFLSIIINFFSFSFYIKSHLIRFYMMYTIVRFKMMKFNEITSISFIKNRTTLPK